ncbi:MAG: hypothetical protein ACR2JR_03790 [Rubrobacteraceae bacterium]
MKTSVVGAGSSDLHAELKLLLGSRCLRYSRPISEPEIERVS